MFSTGIWYLAILILDPLLVLLSIQIRKKWFLPIITAALVYPGFLFELQKSTMRAFAIVVFWTVVQTSTVLYLARKRSTQMNQAIWRAEEYSKSMFQWIETGVLPEGSTAQVILFHLKQTILYCILALVSANFLSLMLGSALLNYMNFYVAQFTLSSRNHAKALLLGWNPWSILRVVSFLWLGVVLSIPVLFKISWIRQHFHFWLLIPGLVGAIGDVILKIALGKSWSKRLKENLAK